MDTESSLSSLRDKLTEEIPLTQPLGLVVARLDTSGLRLEAPLEGNRNHEGTAFAGSVNAVATLAGWGWVWLAVRNTGIGASVVLQNSEIDFLRPITDDFSATAIPPATDEMERFQGALRRRGRARVTVTVEVLAGSELVSRFSGRYVALGQR